MEQNNIMTLKIKVDGHMTKKGKVKVDKIGSTYPQGDRDALGILLFRAMRSNKRFAKQITAAAEMYKACKGMSEKDVNDLVELSMEIYIANTALEALEALEKEHIGKQTEECAT